MSVTYTVPITLTLPRAIPTGHAGELMAALVNMAIAQVVYLRIEGNLEPGDLAAARARRSAVTQLAVAKYQEAVHGV